MNPEELEFEEAKVEVKRPSTYDEFCTYTVVGQGVAFLPLPDASRHDNVHKIQVIDMELIICESPAPEVSLTQYIPSSK